MIHAVAAPVFNAAGDVIAALSVPFVKTDDEAKAEGIGPEVVRTAQPYLTSSEPLTLGNWMMRRARLPRERDRRSVAVHAAKGLDRDYVTTIGAN